MKNAYTASVRRKTLAALGTAVALVLAISACSSGSPTPASTATQASGSDVASTCLPDSPVSSLPSDWKDTVAAARKEGAVTIYSVQPPAVTDGFAAAFEKICPGITVNVVRSDNQSMLTRFNAELQATGKPQADLVESSDTYSLSVDHPDVFRQADSTLIPTLADYPQNAFQGKTWVDFAYLWGVAYNTDKVKDADVPKTWEDVSSAKFKGQITGADPRASTSFQSLYLFLQKTYGDKFLTNMKSLGEVYTATTLPAAQAVAAGQYEIAVPAANSHVAALIKQGAPIKIAFPTPSQLNAGFLGVTNGGPHPNAARVYGAFMASKTGQEVQCDVGALSSLNKTAAGACTAIALPDGLEIADTKPSAAAVSSMAALLGLQ